MEMLTTRRFLQSTITITMKIKTKTKAGSKPITLTRPLLAGNPPFTFLPSQDFLICFKIFFSPACHGERWPAEGKAEGNPRDFHAKGESTSFHFSANHQWKEWKVKVHPFTFHNNYHPWKVKVHPFTFLPLSSPTLAILVHIIITHSQSESTFFCSTNVLCAIFLLHLLQMWSFLICCPPRYQISPVRGPVRIDISVA